MMTPTPERKITSVDDLAVTNPPARL